MPPPTTVPDVLDRVRRSGIIPGERLDSFVAELEARPQPWATPADVLDRFVEAGLLTPFQAERIAAGKYKGFHLGSYLILDQLGSGGMGQVYLAEHLNMRRLAALKVLPPLSFDDPVARERFLREARAAGALDHPNIVRVFDLCQDGKILYLVMEYVDGMSLQTLVTHHGPLEVATACHYAQQVASGLQHAHELGFVHRDIKPANLLVDRQGVVKILDLGLVRSETDAPAGLTRRLDNKLILGTADYVAPEQAVDSSAVDIRADIYSLGATLYFLLTGRTLFPEGRVTQKLVWQQIRQPVPLDVLRPEIPSELAAVVHRMLAKKPDDRFAIPAEVISALAPFVPEEVPVPEPLLLPVLASRRALARSTSGGSALARMKGSPAPSLIATLRTSSGGSSSSGGVVRRLPSPLTETTSDADRIPTTITTPVVSPLAAVPDAPGRPIIQPAATPAPQLVLRNRSKGLILALAAAGGLAVLCLILLLLQRAA
jgi:serine/threonine-protein kinase